MLENLEPSQRGGKEEPRMGLVGREDRGTTGMCDHGDQIGVTWHGRGWGWGRQSGLQQLESLTPAPRVIWEPKLLS